MSQPCSEHEANIFQNAINMIKPQNKFTHSEISINLFVVIRIHIYIAIFNKNTLTSNTCNSKVRETEESFYAPAAYTRKA